MSPTKTAEQIELPFGMWTPAGSRKHVSRWGAHWRSLLIMIEPSMCGGDATFSSYYFDHLLQRSRIDGGGT